MRMVGNGLQIGSTFVYIFSVPRVKALRKQPFINCNSSTFILVWQERRTCAPLVWLRNHDVLVLCAHQVLICKKKTLWFVQIDAKSWESKNAHFKFHCLLSARGQTSLQSRYVMFDSIQVLHEMRDKAWCGCLFVDKGKANTFDTTAGDWRVTSMLFIYCRFLTVMIQQHNGANEEGQRGGNTAW